MKLQLVAIMVACLVVAQGAAAGEAEQDKAWNRHKGFYVEGDLGTGFGYCTVACGGDDRVAASAFDGYAWVGSLGYSLTTHHAVEGGVGQWYKSYEEERDAGYLTFGYLAWRGTVPIKDRFALFGKLGAMYAAAPNAKMRELRDGGLLPFTGLGVSYAVTPQIDLSLQYQGACYVLFSGGVLTLGAGYHF